MLSIKNLIHAFDIYELKWKFVAFVALFIYVIFLFKVGLGNFYTDDPIPDVETVGFEMRKQFKEFSSELRAGIYIKNFSTLDFYNNRFVWDGVVWFEFQKDQTELSVIEKFSFVNGKILQKSEPKVQKYDGKMLVKYDVIVDCKSDLDYHHFPLSDHRLSLILTNEFVTANELYFGDLDNSLSLVISDNLFTSNWKVHSTESSSGYSFVKYDQHHDERKEIIPQAVFTINFDKNGIKDVLVIFIPIFASFFLSLFSFFMSFNNHRGKLAVTLSSITALLSYRFVIQQMMPSVRYFTTTDKIFLLLLIASFVVFIVQIFLARSFMLYSEHGKIPESELSLADKRYLIPRSSEVVNTVSYFAVIVIFAVLMTWCMIK